jgi:putative AlgH/UPF0301 family transcriptional regulator
MRSLLGRALQPAAVACLLGVLALAAQGQQAIARDPVVLVAHPELPDPNFAHSVVLVVFPSNGGPTGVILNQPTRCRVPGD